MNLMKIDAQKSYLKKIRTLLPVFGPQEKDFFRKISGDIEEYVQDHPDVTEDSLNEKFGTPSRNVYEYVESVDTDYLIRKIRVARFVKRSIAVLLVIAAVTAGVISYFSYRDYVEAKDSYIHREVITITEE